MKPMEEIQVILSDMCDWKMPVLTVRQPYASMLMDGTKKYEYRDWKLPEDLTGRYILIHSAKGKPVLFDKMSFEEFSKYYDEAKEQNLYGAILGAVMFGPAQSSNFTSLFKYKWPVIDVIMLKDPIRNISGKQRIWYCDFKALSKKQTLK